MQGRRSSVGSLPETFFDHGSTSSNAAIDQQVCWNSIRNPIENRLHDCLLSSPDMNIAYANSIGREEQELGRWSLGEPSSSGSQNEISLNERKTDQGWLSSVSASTNVGSRLEEQRCEQIFFQSSNAGTVSQNLNLNASVVGNGNDNCQDAEQSNLFKPAGSQNERISPAAGSESFLLSSESGGYAVGGNDSRPGCSYEGHRASCKRKVLEGNIGQSSSSGSSSYYQHAETSAWHGVSASYGAGSSVNIAAPLGQVHHRLGLDVSGSASDSLPEPIILQAAESSHRNVRRRISPSSIHDPIASPIFPSSDTTRQSAISSSQQPRLLPTDHSHDSRSAPVVDNSSPQGPNVVIHVPSLPRNVHPFRWNGGSGSRTGNSSSSNVSRDIDGAPREGHQSRSAARNLLHHPIFVPAPEFRPLVRSQTNRGLNNGHINAPGNVASTSRPGNVASTSRASSSYGANASSASTWVPPNPNPSTQYPRRYSELVRRSLMSTLVAEPGGQGNHSSISSGPASEEMLLSSGIANPGHHRPYPRWLERQDAGFLGIPHSLRTLAAATEGRSRPVVSEIRNVLDLMRRGENLRFEDIMILDQSVFFGVADIHDRHRDMRLDVDNMSYEELLALEERIGNVCTGLNEETVSNHLKCGKVSSSPGTQSEAEPCCICQEEYNDGEDLGTLECGHDFHADCIKQWLMHKNLCPICKTTGLTK